jgi:hypothetical protein
LSQESEQPFFLMVRRVMERRKIMERRRVNPSVNEGACLNPKVIVLCEYTFEIASSRVLVLSWMVGMKKY